MSRGWWIAALAAVALVIVDLVGSAHYDVGGGDLAVELAIFVVAVAAGLAVWALRAERRMGLLLVAYGVVALLGGFVGLFVDSRTAITLVWPFEELSAAVFAHAVLAYPTGRVHDRAERVFVVLAYTVALLYPLVLMTGFDPRGCADCVPSVPSWILVEDYDFSTPLRTVNAGLAVLAGLFVGLVARRIATAPAGARRTLWPLGVAALFAAAQFALGRTARLFEWTDIGLVDTLDQLAGVTVPLALAAGVLMSRRRRRRVGDLVVELGRAGPGHVREALAEAVGDPSLELLLWLPDRGVWVTTDGRIGSLPDDPSRAVTYVGDELAAVVHHPDLVDQRDVIAMAGSAARLALENERLHAELRVQLEELRASRARIVQAGDDERRRLERDLHDGAQQRLLGVGLALQILRPRLGDPAAAEPLLAEAEGELRAGLVELRELARGIHPPLLADEGLAAAVQAIAARSPVPVSVAASDERLPAPVESALYFVAAEALTNVAKYAAATQAWVSVERCNGSAVIEVRDDGRGGAMPGPGSGLTGLADRIGALRGELSIDSEAGSGTRITARVPCA